MQDWQRRNLTTYDYIGYPVPGETLVLDSSESIDLDTAVLNGGALVKIRLLSIDPYLRTKMEKHPDQASVVHVCEDVTEWQPLVNGIDALTFNVESIPAWRNVSSSASLILSLTAKINGYS